MYLVHRIQVDDSTSSEKAQKESRAAAALLSTFGLYAVLSMDISTFCPRTGLGWRGAGGLGDFWLLRHTQMKKNSRAMASGMATLGTRMYKISMLPPPDLSLWSTVRDGAERQRK